MLRQTLRATLDLFYPLRCAGCGRFDVVLCPACAASMTPAIGAGRCRFCSAEWDGGDNCPRCLHMHELEGVRAAFEMTGTARRLVHALKYHHYRAVAPAMAAMMTGIPETSVVDRFFAVPLHKSREKERGFNQSALLLKETRWSPASTGLLRTRKTERQVGQAFGERRANVTDAFVYTGARLDGMTVALVDDVVTTGATMAECARVLKDAGARAVWGFAFARASFKPDTQEVIGD